MSRSCALVGFVGLLALVAIPRANAQVVVTGFYNRVGASYLYNFQVANKSGLDISTIGAIYGVELPAPVISNIVQVPGFTFDVDSITGSIDFVEDTSVFTANQTVGGFRLTSSKLLNVTSVTGLNSNSTPFVGSYAAVAVPEAGTLPLTLLAGSALFGAIVVRRRIA